MTPDLRRSDLRLLALWIRTGLRTLRRTPRTAFFTFVFPAVLLVFIDGTAGGTVSGAGGRVEAAQYFTPSIGIFGLSFGCYTSLVFAIPRRGSGESSSVCAGRPCRRRSTSPR
jgi:hypothetical protein